MPRTIVTALLYVLFLLLWVWMMQLMHNAIKTKEEELASTKEELAVKKEELQKALQAVEQQTSSSSNSAAKNPKTSAKKVTQTKTKPISKPALAKPLVATSALKQPNPRPQAPVCPPKAPSNMVIINTGAQKLFVTRDGKVTVKKN